MNQNMTFELKGCALIPAYLEERRIRGVVQNVLQYIQPVIVIDDGSPDQTSAEASSAGAVVIKHEKNLGKGAALNTGFAYAVKQKFDYVITMDADGQHDPADIPVFVETYRRTARLHRLPARSATALQAGAKHCGQGVSALVGNRMDAPKGMPLVRKLTNIFMSWYLSRQMGQNVPDTQSGFRLYAAQALPFLATQSTRYAAESETLLRLAVKKIRIDSVPIKVIYSDEKSKIRPFRDTIRFFAMIRSFRKKNQIRN